jgi:GNAT superfamily N-acetyltransferase
MSQAPQFDPAVDHTDQRRFADLEAAYSGERELLLVAEEDDAVAGAAMGFASSGEVTLRILAVAAGRRRRGIGRALVRAFEGQRPSPGRNAHFLGRRRRSGLLCPARPPGDAAPAVGL